MVTTVKEPGKQRERELPRWRRILALFDGGLTREEIAEREAIGPEQVRRLINKAREARRKGWI